ncbi:MAG: hypothetical protein ABWY13_11015 [Mesorhizobium sp.]
MPCFNHMAELESAAHMLSLRALPKLAEGDTVTIQGEVARINDDGTGLSGCSATTSV